MSWEFSVDSIRTARRQYHCEAATWIVNSGMHERDFDPEDWAIIERAREELFMILPGMQYLHVRGRWEGDWCTFRARIDMHDICHKYELYDE